jgi:hypothetical protein
VKKWLIVYRKDGDFKIYFVSGKFNVEEKKSGLLAPTDAIPGYNIPFNRCAWVYILPYGS